MSERDDDDLEEERLERLAQLTGEEGPEWPNDYKPGTMGCHELLDRTSVLTAALEAQLLEHPACAMNAEWYALAGQAMSTLNELYEKIAAAHGGQ